MAWFYNRAQALAFAGEFWDRPCRSDTHPLALGMDSARDVPLSAFWDERKTPSTKFEPRFVYNPDIDRDQLVAVPKTGADATLEPIVIIDDRKEGRMLEDCAHFLSQCLKAGGLRIKEQWSVPMLVNELRSGEDQGPRPTAKTLAEKVERKEAQAIIDAGLLTIGDMIGYFADGGYAHSAMYTGTHQNVGRVTCHTKSRFPGLTPDAVPDRWFLANPDYKFTLLHIPRVSESTPAIGASIAGWWRVTRGQQTEFYYVFADGRAMRTARAPKTAKAPTSAGTGDSRGYWFERHGKVMICWRQGGSLVVLEAPANNKPASISIDKAPANAVRF